MKEMITQLKTFTSLIVIFLFFSSVVLAQTAPQKQEMEQQIEQTKQQAKLQAEQAKQQMQRETERAKQQAHQQAERAKQQAQREKQQIQQQAERAKQQAQREVERAKQQAALADFQIEIKKEFAVSAMPELAVSNMFGGIQIIEGANDKISFNITITGKGKDKDEAKKYAEAVEVDLKQSGNSVSAKTVFNKDIKCNNCGRNVNMEITVPRNTKLVLDNQYGDIKMNNTSEPLKVNLQFGKLFANVVSNADLTIQYGGATINQCNNLKIKSGFSKYELGDIESMTGTVSYDGFKISELGSADIVSDFTNVDISTLKQSFTANKFAYGSLKIGQVSENFVKIKADASFTTVKIGLTDKHNFKTNLSTNFGNIKTGKVVFYEKTFDKKDAITGVAGKLKDPAASVEISNSYGNILFE